MLVDYSIPGGLVMHRVLKSTVAAASQNSQIRKKIKTVWEEGRSSELGWRASLVAFFNAKIKLSWREKWECVRITVIEAHGWRSLLHPALDDVY